MTENSSQKINLLVETYRYVYLTELDHYTNNYDLCKSAGITFEESGYFEMWQRSKKALDNLEEYWRTALNDRIDGHTLRQELEKMKLSCVLCNEDSYHIDRILRM